MGRNSELIRQWTLLRTLASRAGNTIPKLAKELKVTSRTVRRDLDALQAAGFPIFDDVVNGTKFWRLKSESMVAALARNAFTIHELFALYSSRALLRGVVSTQLSTELQSALDKLQAALPPGMKKLFDRLPEVIVAKPSPGKARVSGQSAVVTRLLEAATSRHVISMRYHSNGSRREKEYTLHPYRVAYAQNGIYLQAFVPAYNELRTFAVERIKHVSVQTGTFEPVAELGADPFGKSMGVHTGPTVKVRLRFAPQVASFMRERTWHESQQLKDRPDGSIVLTMHVCDDYALRQWILGFGRLVRVLGPPALVEWVHDEHDEARQQYGSGEFVGVDGDLQPALPFLFGQIGSA